MELRSFAEQETKMIEKLCKRRKYPQRIDILCHPENKIAFFVQNNFTVCFLYVKCDLIRKDTYFMGVSKRNPKLDEENKNIGESVALSRCIDHFITENK